MWKLGRFWGESVKVGVGWHFVNCEKGIDFFRDVTRIKMVEGMLEHRTRVFVGSWEVWAMRNGSVKQKIVVWRGSVKCRKMNNFATVNDNAALSM